jgi:hypothetical protein
MILVLMILVLMTLVLMTLVLGNKTKIKIKIENEK